MSSPNTDEGRISRIFFPYIVQKVEEVTSKKLRFAYYTTAETATCILRNSQIWMRSTAVMNDYMEVAHGLECFEAAYKGDPDNSFNSVLNNCFPDLADEMKCTFDDWRQRIRQDSYITCLSEHLSDEDQHGRLSMWRAYGQGAGVVLVLNNTAMLSTSHALNVYSSPVAYLTAPAFRDEFLKIAKNMESEVEFIKTLGREKVKDIVFRMFLFTVLCTKHHGFQEEREWRVIATSAMPPKEHVTLAVEVVSGIPQIVRKFSLRNYPDEGLVGLALSELLDKIIIGPCAFPQIIRSAFLQLLQEAGVTEPETKIIVSGIPLRQLSDGKRIG